MQNLKVASLNGWRGYMVLWSFLVMKSTIDVHIALPQPTSYDIVGVVIGDAIGR